ncbi:MAG TPA: stage V sporulation protein AD [Desulfobacteria bacterium]|nr:stage V sporulation protein AD [Desulfobacteria bacterium]
MTAPKLKGKQTVAFATPPVIVGFGSVVGPMEAQGPLGSCFHKILKDTLDGEQTWEKTESKMLKDAVKMVIAQAQLTDKDINYLLAGDLLNQIISTNYAARDVSVPLIGLYGACSTMALGLALGSMLIDGGYGDRVVAAASSHHDTAERQFRFPTELGSQRQMYAQWTVTGAGATLLAKQGYGVKVTHATMGKIVDLGVCDVNNMGAAMAPAITDTIISHFKDLAIDESAYDLVISGDLGQVGLDISKDLLRQAGYQLDKKFTDCGVLIYDPNQDTHAGGSGCGCSAVVINSHIMQELLAGRLRRVLFVGSGALMSSTSCAQGESIPAIGHAVVLEAPA